MSMIGKFVSTITVPKDAPLKSYRTFIRDSKDKDVLHSLYYLCMKDYCKGEWYRSGYYGSEAVLRECAPAPYGNEGFYGYKDYPKAYNSKLNYIPWSDCEIEDLVIALVEFAGTIQVHESGYRAEYMRIVEIEPVVRIPDPSLWKRIVCRVVGFVTGTVPIVLEDFDGDIGVTFKQRKSPLSYRYYFLKIGKLRLDNDGTVSRNCESSYVHRWRKM